MLSPKEIALRGIYGLPVGSCRVSGNVLLGPDDGSTIFHHVAGWGCVYFLGEKVGNWVRRGCRDKTDLFSVTFYDLLASSKILQKAIKLDYTYRTDIPLEVRPEGFRAKIEKELNLPVIWHKEMVL